MLFLWRSFFLILFLAEFVNLEELIFEDFSEYPIIVNTDSDKAVFIVPHKGCHIITRRDGLELTFLKQNLNIFKEDGKTVDDIITLCELYQNETIDGNEFLQGVRLRAFLIYPGTKWCGAGNRANNESDLGYNTETDKCCREHDFCQDYVDGLTCHPTNGLCNNTPFTRSHCNCDNRLRECLYKANETAGRRIGTLYFTIFGLKCFRQDYPIIECLEYGGFLNIHCQKYLLNYEEEPSFQFFDSPKYDSSNVSQAEESPSPRKGKQNQGTMQMSISFERTKEGHEVKHLSF